MLYLASQSPRRAQLLRQIGVDFVVHPANIDETPHADELPAVYVQRLAHHKAITVFTQVAATRTQPCRVLAADTTVVYDGQLLGKPSNAIEAHAMLRCLSGQTHHVLTGLAVCDAHGIKTVLSCTEVTFASLSDACIAAYVASGEPFDKAGGYGIQGIAGMFVANLRGSYSGVMGLPLYEAATLLGLLPRDGGVTC